MAGTPQEPRFIEPPNTLKVKVGHGGIPPELLKKSQDYIESSIADFSPYAQKFLDEINGYIKQLKENKDLRTDRQFINKMAQPIMNLKANGGMFKYPLVSMIADVGLQFIDRAGELNEDGIEILRAHNGSISLILANRLKGYAGPEGNKITEELREACNRYFKKYNL